jgi:hypothetical protein
MLIKESKLRQIIKSVIRESMAVASMPPSGGGIDPKIQAMNLLKNRLKQMSGGKIDMYVEQTVEEHIEDDRPCVYGSFKDMGGANFYSVYMCDDEFRIALDASDEIDQMCVPVNPSQVVADGAASLAAEVMQEWSNNFPGAGDSTMPRGANATVNNDWEDEEDDSYDSYDSYGDDFMSDDPYADKGWNDTPPPKPVKPKRQRSGWSSVNSQIGRDNRLAQEQSYQADLAAYEKELAAWEAKYGK